MVVTLRGNAANLRLMTWSDLNSYKNGRNHRCYGGLATSSPARIAVPRGDHWYLTALRRLAWAGERGDGIMLVLGGGGGNGYPVAATGRLVLHQDTARPSFR
ncbi:MAG: DUF1883 domain-containing protein [Streptosporangiaceae bacterium]